MTAGAPRLVLHSGARGAFRLLSSGFVSLLLRKKGRCFLGGCAVCFPRFTCEQHASSVLTRALPSQTLTVSHLLLLAPTWSLQGHPYCLDVTDKQSDSTFTWYLMQGHTEHWAAGGDRKPGPRLLNPCSPPPTAPHRRKSRTIPLFSL